MLNRVTISGPDEEVDPQLLKGLSEKYPFVEWGILLSHSREGQPRYPGMNWVSWLPDDVNLSGHLCGRYCREVEDGNTTILESLGHFKRIQMNIGGRPITPTIYQVAWKFPQFEFIIQLYNEANYTKTYTRHMSGQDTPKNISYLHDRSGGLGTPMAGFPVPIPGVSNGYAGGVRPSNFTTFWEQISTTLGDTPGWIDSETGARTIDNKFSVEAVTEMLGIAQQKLTYGLPPTTLPNSEPHT